MPTNEEIQSQLKALFRADELKNRAGRRQRLLNEMQLAGEPLTPEDVEADKAAKENLIRQQLAFERETSPGYWTRLWKALLNR